MNNHYKSNPYEFINNYINDLKWYQKIWFKLYCRYKFSYKYKIVPTTKDIDYRILSNDKFTVSKVEPRKER